MGSPLRGSIKKALLQAQAPCAVPGTQSQEPPLFDGSVITLLQNRTHIRGNLISLDLIPFPFCYLARLSPRSFRSHLLTCHIHVTLPPSSHK